jgi:hypothetical protein
MAQPFFCEEWSISQNWDGQPAFKFDENIDVPCIYCTIPRNMHVDVEWVHGWYNKFWKSDHLEWYAPKKVSTSKETRCFWYHAIDTNYLHILVKFERRLSVQFVSKKEKRNFFQRDGSTPLFLKNDLFLRTEINNLRSHLTRVWTCFVPNVWYQKTCIWMSNGFMSATINVKKRPFGVGKRWERESYLAFRRSRPLNRGRVDCGALPMSIDEGARKTIDGKKGSFAGSGVWNTVWLQIRNHFAWISELE